MRVSEIVDEIDAKDLLDALGEDAAKNYWGLKSID